MFFKRFLFYVGGEFRKVVFNIFLRGFLSVSWVDVCFLGVGELGEEILGWFVERRKDG